MMKKGSLTHFRYSFLALIYTITVIVGCKDEREIEYEIYENHDISACGFYDPLVNVDWLAEFCSEHSQSYSIEIFMYENDATGNNHIVIEAASKKEEGVAPSPIYTTKIFSCDGEQLLFHGTEGPYPPGWDEFFESNEMTTLLWSIKMIE